ncbi:sulfatase family protein [Parafilimonas terrae]|uniref:Arylsulfatase A n=1 Tax=Parafilimonas terrae TaxID=1465490 RepID=A0A1I5SLU9_9BACT|nr:arylsulfatase [Parafilimonas terrae]SFP71688.1 Arylsulfatase A [Parafilimonas terrae]
MNCKRLLLLSFLTIIFFTNSSAQQKPNVIIINADDLGYGDLSCYGATKIHTPNIDKLAASGIRFTNAHSSAATCTPSRYSLLTGKYAWRKNGTGILPGDAALIIPTDTLTLPKVFKQAGYATAIVGKWHLGLGNTVEKNWNEPVAPGPREVGFDYSFIFPATADRVPTVFLENQTIVGLDKTDPINVDYKQKVGNDPTGKENPELLKLKSSPNHGHDQTIVNGIGRIGYMTGGKTARWTDEELSFTFLSKAKTFINKNKQQPFFLYYALNQPHVPRMPATMFKDTSGLGYRGDVIVELDWCVGEIMKELTYLGLNKNTIIIFTSDNGPVLDDGYQDEAVTRSNGHKPAGPFRGGKYSIFEGGTRMPFIVSWPGNIRPGTSDALVCQVDFLASFAGLFKEDITAFKSDSKDVLNALLGKDKKGRNYLIEQAGALAVIKDNWKYIAPNNLRPYAELTATELGNAPVPQLYDLSNDIGETNNAANQYPEKVKELEGLLQQERSKQF